MNILKSVSVSFALALLCSTAHGQVGRRLQDAAGRAAERAATNQTERRVEDAVNKGIDSALDGNNNQQQQQEQQQEQQQQQAPAPASPTSPTSSASPTVSPAQTPQQVGTALEMTYAKNDFVPGDEIIFEDLMDGEKLGEFPSMWDLLRGSAEVATFGGIKGVFMEARGTTLAPLMKNMKSYLPDVFTVEFDYWINWANGKHIEPNQRYLLHFFDANDNSIMELEFAEGSVRWYYKTPADEDREGNLEIDEKVNSWSHLSVSFNKRAFKAYVNGVRVVNIPSMAVPVRLSINTTEYEDHRCAITNFRIAKGAVPLYDRMMSDGKFITYGITFDVGKSTIKPESMGEINRIATLLKENPDLKFSVEGHTDSTGSAATNQTLSEARSQAVVDKLVENGIARDRLQAAGKGQTSPIADNGTDEGRAKNRRVEFVKI